MISLLLKRVNGVCVRTTPEGSELANLLTRRLTDEFDKISKRSNSRTTVCEAKCWLDIFQLLYEKRPYVDANEETNVLKELSIICRFYNGYNLLEIVHLVLRYILYVNASDPSYFTPEKLSYPFLELLENTSQKHLQFQMYQLFSPHMRIEHVPSMTCLYNLMNVSINGNSRQKRKCVFDAIRDVEIGKKRKLF